MVDSTADDDRHDPGPGSPDAGDPPPLRRRRAGLAIGGAIVVAGAVAAAVSFSGESPDAPEASPTTASQPPEVEPAESPRSDGSSVPSDEPRRSDAIVIDASSDPEVIVYSFDDAAELDGFRWGVYHRNLGHQEFGRAPTIWGDGNAIHGGEWTGDHDETCGAPTSQRPLSSTKEDGFHVEQLVYVCRDHMMTSMGDVDGYSIVWFSPDVVYPAVASVCVDVNLTDLGTRQWWKIGVVSDELFVSETDGRPAFLMSDVGAADLPGHLVGPDHLIASWSGGASAGYPGGMKIGDTKLDGAADAGTDKATRHEACLTDHGDGRVTFAVAGEEVTGSGAFPACPCRVVFYDHNYTPDKNEEAPGVQAGYTWHWDEIVIAMTR